MKINLHGLKHQEVPKFLEGHINELWDTDTEVEIITGHSPRMKKIVSEILDEYKLSHSVNMLNPGCIKTTI